MKMYPNSPAAATGFLNFVNASPTPFHAVMNAVTKLEKAGFKKVRETEEWEKDVKAGGKYYFTRNQAALVAFTLPKSWSPTSRSGVSIVATHVDSPNLKVRPVSKRTAAGYLQVGVETYGGGVWASWFNRDLSLAGRIIVAEGNTFRSRLIKIDRPLMSIPALAIHLDRTVNDGFKFNQETQFVPILGLIEAELNGTSKEDDDSKKPSAPGVQNNHHPALLSLLASEISVKQEDIHDFELSLYDTNPATLGGLNNEFIFSPRMDNLVSSFCAVEAMANSVTAQEFPALEGNVNAIFLFNHEEIGSVSTTGAESNLLPSLISRLSASTAKSFLISADMGHAINPNYQSKHETNHAPQMNKGIVIKTNAKQRYASDAVSSFIVKQLVERKGGKYQEFEVRNDMPCGSTVGPMLSKLGVRTVDIGNAMLSMHSIRECAGTHDVQNAIDLFASLFEGFHTVDKTLFVD